MDLGKLPQLQGWVTGDGADPRAFLLAHVTVGEAAALAAVLWPEFVEYRGGVFLRFGFDRVAVDRWFDELKDDRRAVEGVVNHVHLWDFLAPRSDPEYAAVAALAARVGEMWEAALTRRFPGRTFVVTVTAGDDGDYGPTVAFSSA